MTAKICQNLPKIIVFVATELEAAVLEPYNGEPWMGGVEVVVTGIGPVNAAIAVMAAVQRAQANSTPPEILLQLGIGGAIDHKLKLGEVLAITTDSMPELGAWRAETKTLQNFRHTIYTSTLPTPDGMPMATAQTVTMACNPLIAHDSARTARSAQVESMEGAPFLQAAHTLGIPALQIRAISNYTTQPRDQWQIPLAIKNLTAQIPKIFTTFAK